MFHDFIHAVVDHGDANYFGTGRRGTTMRRLVAAVSSTASIDGKDCQGARYGGLTYLVNVDKVQRRVSDAGLRGKRLTLHPVHTAKGAADRRAAQARFDSASGSFTVPARTAVVFVAE